MMESKDLAKVWSAPDNTRLTPKQLSIRLPLHVAAKISALSDMFPNKTKTEIIGDLLSTALQGLAEGLSNEPYPFEEETHPDDTMGDRRRYYELSRKYLEEMETDATGDSSDEEGTSRKEANKGVPRSVALGERGKRAASGRRTLARAKK